MMNQYAVTEFISDAITHSDDIVKSVMPIMALRFGGGPAQLHTGMSNSSPDVSVAKLCDGYEWESGEVVTHDDMAQALACDGFSMISYGNDIGVYARWLKKPANILLEMVR